MGQSQNAITLTGNCSVVLQLLRDASPSVNGGVSTWPTSPDSCLMKWERESLRSKRAFTNAGTVLPDLHSGEEVPRSKSILWLPERLAPWSSNAAVKTACPLSSHHCCSNLLKTNLDPATSLLESLHWQSSTQRTKPRLSLVRLNGLCCLASPCPAQTGHA